ncbi:MAG: hypothetical protein BRD23_08075 [Halobacteriales archaeon SW_9_67_25]|jgi:hypothetical protein|nr:MAG: hypothetical protein BRD23_08075 [Halobacteriales archaeon SW_9_67_25]
MGHECDACGETFGTLSRLRLHDCPGVDFDDDERLAALAGDLASGLDRGTIISRLPDGGIELSDVETLRAHDSFLAVISPMNNPRESTTERLALLVEGHAYVTEYFPGENGWVVTREEETRDMAKDEAKDTLRKLIQDWQSVVTELSLDYAGGDDGVYDRLRKELNL